jgi:hypothetical protein
VSRSLGRALPDVLAACFHGGPADTGTALLLATVDAAGRPHFALLSASEVVTIGASTVRLGTYATSTTSGNLRDHAVLALLAVHDGRVFTVKGRARELPGVAGYPSLARFEMDVEDVLVDATREEEGGASVLSGITYRRHEPSLPLADMLRA